MDSIPPFEWSVGLGRVLCLGLKMLEGCVCVRCVRCDCVGGVCMYMWVCNGVCGVGVIMCGRCVYVYVCV